MTRPLAFALLAAFLLSRRSHSAVTSHFYIESAEPMLIFGALLAWSSGRRTLYWATLVLAMGCKEDVAVYFLAFGAMIAVTGLDRKTGLATIAVAVAWLISSFGVAIPYWRGAYGLGAASPFLEGRYASTQGALAWALLDRLVSLQSLKRLITVTSATGYLCFLAPRWLAVALPGIALNLVAIPGTEQAALSGHYLWPILPWLFVAAVFGGTRLRGTTARWLPVMVLVVVLVDNPLPGSLARASWNASPETKLLKAQLQDLALSGTIAAQPNLIPHLPRRREMAAFGVLSAGQPDGEYVLLTTVGDLWPFDARGLADQVERLRNDPGYQQVLNGPLFAFRRRERRLTELSYKATLTAAPSNSSRP